MSLEKVGKLIGANVVATEDQGRNVTQRSNANNWFLLPHSRLSIRMTGATVNKQLLTGEGLVWGHPEYGLWGTGAWATENSFILGHSTYGVIGSSVLGGGLPDFVVDGESYDTNKLTVGGLNEVSDFLATGDAFEPTHLLWGNGTVAYNSGMTAMSGSFGTALIGTALVGDSSFSFSSDVSSINFGSAGVNVTQIGFSNETNNILYFYATLQESIDLDFYSNYEMGFTGKVYDSSKNSSLWTNQGTATVGNFLGGVEGDYPTHVGFGTGTTFTGADTVLPGEFLRKTLRSSTNVIDLQNEFKGVMTTSEGVGTVVRSTGLFSGGTADVDAKLLCENNNYSISKTDLFQIDFNQINYLD